MYAFLLQDWLTIRGAPSVATVTQTENCWLDLSGYQDVVAWLDVKNFTSSGATIQLAYQSAVSKDDVMFQRLVSPISVSGTGISITTMLKELTTTPLARWFRWQISVSGSPSATWDATFRILIAANAIGSMRAPTTAATVPT